VDNTIIISWMPTTYKYGISFHRARLITGFVTRLTRRVPLVEQEQLTLPEHLSPSPVRVARSLVLCVCFVDRCLSLCPFSFIVLSVLH
jgi:hypothetical protein